MAVELKDFIKTVLCDITSAVKEAQQEISNGAVISPGIAKDMARAYIYNGRDYSPITDTEFEVSVYGEKTIEDNKGIGFAVKTFIAGTSSKGASAEKEASRIKFSIPIALPSEHAKECLTETERRSFGSSPKIFSH